MDKIHDEMSDEESLLICCKAFQPECESAFKNIAIKKIPKMLLGRCEFDKNNYNLNIISLPEIDDCEENEDALDEAEELTEEEMEKLFLNE